MTIGRAGDADTLSAPAELRHRILLVDDNVDEREALECFLGTEGLDVCCASDGHEALYVLRNGPRPCLILLDLNMPGLDGRKTLEIIKSTASMRNIPVVVLTTSDDERDVSACYALGANTYIQKPVDLDGLIAAVGRLKEYWFEIAILPKGPNA